MENINNLKKPLLEAGRASDSDPKKSTSLFSRKGRAQISPVISTTETITLSDSYRDLAESSSTKYLSKGIEPALTPEEIKKLLSKAPSKIDLTIPKVVAYLLKNPDALHKINENIKPSPYNIGPFFSKQSVILVPNENTITLMNYFQRLQLANSSTDQKVIEFLAKDDTMKYYPKFKHHLNIVKVAISKLESPEILTALFLKYTDPNFAVKPSEEWSPVLNLLKSTFLPDACLTEAVEILGKHHDAKFYYNIVLCEMAMAILGNPKVSENTINKFEPFIREPFVDKRDFSTKHFYLEHSYKEQLALLTTIAIHPHTPLSLIKQLKNLKIYEVNVAITRNKSQNKEIKKIIQIIKNEFTAYAQAVKDAESRRQQLERDYPITIRPRQPKHL